MRNSLNGTRITGWRELMEHCMKLTADYDHNMYVMGWLWGINPLNNKMGGMIKSFNEGFKAGREHYKTIAAPQPVEAPQPRK